MQLLMTAASVTVESAPIAGALLVLVVLGSYIAISLLLVRHYAQKYNEKIMNGKFN